MTSYPFAIIGTGWRAQFFLRVAAALPEHFHVAGVVSRRPADERAAFSAQWNVPIFATVDELLVTAQPAFTVVSVRRAERFERFSELASYNMPILAETPPADDLTGLLKVMALVENGARIQIAEQYFMQPIPAAMLRLIEDGLIGQPSYAHISVMQTYHGISLMRKFLGLGFDNATITARQFELPIVKGPDRYNQPDKYEIIPASQTIATFDFGGRVGVYDFANAQHRSRIRTPRLTVRGERGEITPEAAQYLVDEHTPVCLDIRRCDTGHFTNFEGYNNAGIQAGGKWVYTNPYSHARLSDDEIAVASVMDAMRAYTETGESFYSFADAAQDCYLAFEMERAAVDGKAIATMSQPWSRSD